MTMFGVRRMIDTDKYEGHLASEGQTWAWSKWMLNNAETIEQHEATSALLNDAPLLLAEVKRLRRLNNYLWEHRSSHWSADDDAEMDRLEMIE